MLTKENLFAMSKNEYMNQTQLDFFRDLLQSQLNQLNISIKQAKESLLENEHNIDPSDVASQQEMQQLYLRTVEREGRLLNKVNKSLQSIENGEYGYCEATGEPIGLQRLYARPTASLSITAKEAQEHKEKTEGS
jgi:DnaK suppressor protein